MNLKQHQHQQHKLLDVKLKFDVNVILNLMQDSEWYALMMHWWYYFKDFSWV